MPQQATRDADPPASGAGLSATEAARRLAAAGPNVVATRQPARLRGRVLRQLRDPLIVVLLVAAVLTAVTADWADMTVILLVVVVNTVVGLAQEIRADRAIAALSAMTAPTARVVRDGAQAEVPAEQVVTGDLIVLGEGDVVPADARLVDAAALMVDESALTGESVAVDKDTVAVAGAGAGDAGLLSAGTVVVHGRGRAVVTATGADSAMGRIALLMRPDAGLTPLQRRLMDVSAVLAVVAVALCVVVLVLGLLRGLPLELMVVTSISLAVAAVPESLPAVVTLALALGARRMADRDAVIRRLPAVETLGSMTVLATDKTGTLTEGRMVARLLWTPDSHAEITGTGYDPSGAVRTERGALGPEDDPALTALLTAAALCNDARLVPPDTTGPDTTAPDTAGGPSSPDSHSWSALGDPTEAALLTAAARLGLDPHALNDRLPRVAERPFDSDRKRMSTIHRLPDGGYRVVCKGAPEAVLNPATVADTPEAIAVAAGWARDRALEGYRVLAVATRELPALAGQDDDIECDLHLIGLIALADPPRAVAAQTIRDCRAAGIRPVLITGDHPGTARAIATELGIIAAGEPVVDLREPSPGIDADAAVFARATPAQKLDLIQRLRDREQVVAMTGDGVNDGPALRRADIGVAMGRRGTEVARQAADLVLADDDLGTVVIAVAEGRRVYANIRRFLVYGLSGGAAEIAVMLIGPFLGLPLPLLPAQILWINLLTHGLPGVALGGEPAQRDILRRPPRPRSQSILGAGLWQRVLRLSVVLTAVTLGVAVWADATGRPWQSMAFFALGATQLAVALGSRSRQGSLANPSLLVAVGGAFALQLAALYLPPLRELLGTEPLAVSDLLLVTALSVSGYVAARLDRIIHPAPRGDRS
ncbi:MAG TPA: cation-transporting P-type ATPase [Nocardia sp.]|uniref:cation-translocating P-type ATPase n=1 Tax=Nocardia sp. TaxID=1821 RepID=UPI002B4B1718|nr:cation-transporting P-type ATPase [Nocardia sp.]HLS78806.1 cation-transporting P-type ATPase [Nocardia sp.]